MLYHPVDMLGPGWAHPYYYECVILLSLPVWIRIGVSDFPLIDVCSTEDSKLRGRLLLKARGWQLCTVKRGREVGAQGEGKGGCFLLMAPRIMSCQLRPVHEGSDPMCLERVRDGTADDVGGCGICHKWIMNRKR